MGRHNVKLNYSKEITNLLSIYSDIQNDEILTDEKRKLIVTLLSNLLAAVNEEKYSYNKCAIIVDLFLVVISPIGLEVLKSNLKLKDTVKNKISEFLNTDALTKHDSKECNYLNNFLNEVQKIFDLTFK